MSQSPREQANAAIKKFLSRRDWSAESPARRRTLAAFLRLATEHGFESVSMRTLGHELGLKAPSLYSSFPHGKDEIVAESLRWFTYRFAHDLLDAALPSRSPEEYWEVLVRFHFAQQLRRPEADLWNFLVARDKVAPFLDPDAREEAYSWLGCMNACTARRRKKWEGASPLKASKRSSRCSTEHNDGPRGTEPKPNWNAFQTTPSS